MLKLILHVITIVVFLLGFLRLKKSLQSERFVKWLGISILTMMLCNSVIAGIYGLIGLPISCVTIDIPMLILGFFLFYLSLQNNQKYCILKSDYFFLGCLSVATFLFFVGYFHMRLPIRYVSVDASVHCRWAKQIATEHTLNSNLFFGYVNDGIIMEALFALTGINGFYHSFTLMRIFDFFMCGLLFYGVIIDICKTRYEKIVCFIITFLYMCGYPLYALMFGFVYFGDAVTLLSGLMIVMQIYKNKEVNHKYLLILLNLFLFGIFTTYTLFVPSIFLAVLIEVLLLLKEKGKLFTIENLKEILKIFVFPCLLGMAYAYVNLKEVTSSGGISNEGGKYFDLYSNFIILLPFVVSALWNRITYKKIDFQFVLFIIVSLFTLLLFVGAWIGYVSTYYLSKMYNILWLCCFLFLCEELCRISQYSKAFINTGLATFIVLLSFIGVDADTKFNEMGYIYSGASGFANIYQFNWNFFVNQGIMDETDILMYEKASNLLDQKNTNQMLFIGTEIPANWYKTFTGSFEIETSENLDTVKQRLNSNKYEYIFLKSSLIEENNDYFLSLGVLVDSADGVEIIQIK